MSEVYLVDQDYQATISVCEAGLELVNRHRKNTGSDLTLYVILLPKDLADDSLKCSKIIQRRLVNVSRTFLSSQASHKSCTHIR